MGKKKSAQEKAPSDTVLILLKTNLNSQEATALAGKTVRVSRETAARLVKAGAAEIPGAAAALETAEAPQAGETAEKP